MTKFSFRLKTLLRLRQAGRDERRAELAQACQAEEILRKEGRQLATELEELAQRCRAKSSPGRVDVDTLLDARRYELVLRAGSQRLDQQLQAVAAEIQRRRAALAEADREVRVLEKLRQKQYDRHRDEMNRQEIKLLDEVAARRAAAEEGP
jgi:flagellar export protein FliJ